VTLTVDLRQRNTQLGASSYSTSTGGELGLGPVRKASLLITRLEKPVTVGEPTTTVESEQVYKKKLHLDTATLLNYVFPLD